MYLNNVDVLFVQQCVLIEQEGPSFFLHQHSYLYVNVFLFFICMFIYSADEKQEPLWAV